MTIVLTWLKLFPALLALAMNAAHEIELGFSTVADATGNSAAKTGASKIAFFEQGIQAVLNGIGTAAGVIPLDTLTGVAKQLTSIASNVFTALGWFKHSPPAAPAAPAPATPQQP